MKNMQPKVIQTSNTKKNKDKNDSKKSIIIIKTILPNSNEMSKHKSQEIYAQYSPSNLNDNNNNSNNNPTSNNNSKKNTALANTIKQIIHYSGIKKGTNSKNIESNKNPKDKDSTINENRKQKSSKDYTNININDINLKQEENISKKLKRNNLDNILSESDSCQEIDSMEEDSLSKGNRIKNTNMNFKKHLTTGFNNKSNNLKENKNSISTFTKQKTAKEKKTKYMNINTNNEDTEEEIIINDNNEFDNPKTMQNNKLNETKFPNLSINPFTNENILSENNIDLYKKSTSSKINNKNNNKLKSTNNKKKENKENEKIIFSNHHIKSSTLGTIKQSSTNPNSSNLINVVDNLSKKENTEINKNNNNINQNINIEHLYRNLLLMSKKGDREQFLEILEKIFSLPNNLININYQDENGFSALHFSCDEGNLKIVEILLKANCETNIKNNEKKTPLHLASKRGYFDISKKLIESGALLNIYDSEKNSPIHYVCMYNHIELLKFFLGKLPQADEKNIYGKMPIDLTDNIEMKNILENYLKKNENSYHKIRIYQTSDSKMKNMIESNPSGEEIDEEEHPQSRKYLSNKNNLNMNININTNNLKNNKNSSLSPSPNKNNPRNKLKNRKQDFNSIQPKSNIIKKNTLNLELQNSHNPNFDINKSPHNLNTSNIKINHNNTINAKENVSSVLKKSEIKSSIKLQEYKHNPNANTIKKNNINNHNNHPKKNNYKILIQDSNINNNKAIKNINGLKKTKTVEQFSTKNSSKNNLYKINLMNSNKDKPKPTLNDSRINHPNYCNINLNINNSINNGINRINISFNNKNEIKKLNKSISRFGKDKKKGITNSENKNKLIRNNLKHKNILLDSLESNNNIINLNKTEENNLSKISKKSLNKIKNVNISINLNSSKTLNDKDYNAIKIIENKEINLSKGKNKYKNKNAKNKKKENQKNKDKVNNNEINSSIHNNKINNINLDNCNISKISCGPQLNTNNILDPINKTNIVDQTLADNFHAQLNLNSIEEERITPSNSRKICNESFKKRKNNGPKFNEICYGRKKCFKS